MSDQLQMLGVPKLVAGADMHTLPLAKPATLLYYLAWREEWVSRAELAFLYRPDTDAAAALNYLRGLVFRAKTLDWARNLEVQSERLRWLIPHDVRRFSDHVADGRWSDALRLYRGAFLEGLEIREPSLVAAWIEETRNHLDALRDRAMLNHALDHERDQNVFAAERLWSELVARNPYHEQAVEGLMRALYAQGDRERAVTVYERFRSQLKVDLDMLPIETTRSLAERIRTGAEPPDDIRSGQVHERLHAYPSRAVRKFGRDQATRLVGRKRELRVIERKRADPSYRLIVISGMGGVGKTRLALDAAAAAQASYRDGVAFVELAQTDPSAVVTAVADGLGLPLQPDRDPKDQLMSYLRSKHMLCVLDNAEQIDEDGVQLLAEVIEAAPGVDILVTSRAALGLRHEWILDLEGLPVPPADSHEPPESFGAVELFLQLVEHTGHEVPLTESDMDAVVAVCRRLEGLPLALELAAGWTRILSIPEVDRRLSSPLDLLETHQRDRPARHASIRAVLESSWSQLGPAERTSLARLSIFRGGCTIKAASMIVGATLPVLLGLKNRSLLQRKEPGRFGLHELVRQFAEERLDLTPSLQDDFCDFYLDLLIRTDSDSRNSLASLASEWSNIHRAWTWAVELERVDLLESACEPLRRLCEARGHFSEGIRLLGLVMAAFDPNRAGHQRIVGRASIAHAWLLGWIGNAARASEEAQAGLTLLEPLDDDEHVLLGLRTLGHAAFRAGQMQKAEAPLERALSMARQIENVPSIMGILATLGLVWTWLDDLARAEEALTEALRLAHRLSRTDVVVESQMGLAVLDYMRGAYVSARSRLERAIIVCERERLRGHLPHLLFNLGQNELKLGRSKSAKALCEQALDLATENDDSLAEVMSRAFLGNIALAESDLETAEDQLIRSLARAWHKKMEAAQPLVLIYVAELRLKQGKALEGAELIGMVLAYVPFVPRLKGLAEPVREALQSNLTSHELHDAFERGARRSIEEVVVDLL